MRSQLNKLEKAFGPDIHAKNFGRSEQLMVEIEPARLLEVAAWLRMEETYRMDFLEALTVFENKGRLFFSYFLRSLSQNLQLVLRTSVPVPEVTETVTIPSVIGIWPGAEPFESELSPLFGVEFSGDRGKGDVRKNFGDYRGFPLRKAFGWQEEITP